MTLGGNLRSTGFILMGKQLGSEKYREYELIVEKRSSGNDKRLYTLSAIGQKRYFMI